MTKLELLKHLQEIQVITQAPVVLRSGEKSDLYCDMGKVFEYPDILNALADEIGALLPPGATCVAASRYGGLPLGAVVASRFNLPFVGVRNTAKEHGMKGTLRGYIPTEKDTLVIIDDVLTTGSSIKETLAELEKTSVKNISALVAIKRTNASLPIPYSHLFDIIELNA